MCILYSPRWDVPGGGSKPGRARRVCCRLTTVTSSPWMPTSGRLKWHRAVMAAMLAASIRFPSWFSIWTSTLICHTLKHTHTRHITSLPSIMFSLISSHLCVFTFSPDTTHRDSVSMHLEFLKHLSSCLFSFTDSSDCLETNGELCDLQSLHTQSELTQRQSHLNVSLDSAEERCQGKIRCDGTKQGLFHTCPVQMLARP